MRTQASRCRLRRRSCASIVALAALGLAPIAVAPACSSSSSIAGIGACEGFCNKWVGAHCKNAPKTHEECLGTAGPDSGVIAADFFPTGCLDAQRACEVETNALIRCATIDGTIACETGTGKPKVLSCEKQLDAVRRCEACDALCQKWTGTSVSADAGPPVPPCKRSPTRDGCMAGCLAPQCAAEIDVFRSCATLGVVTCDERDEPTIARCLDSWGVLQDCLCKSASDCVNPLDWPKPVANP